jgi:hypothetical protein
MKSQLLFSLASSSPIEITLDAASGFSSHPMSSMLQGMLWAAHPFSSFVILLFFIYLWIRQQNGSSVESSNNLLLGFSIGYLFIFLSSSYPTLFLWLQSWIATLYIILCASIVGFFYIVLASVYSINTNPLAFKLSQTGEELLRIPHIPRYLEIFLGFSAVSINGRSYGLSLNPLFLSMSGLNVAAFTFGFFLVFIPIMRLIQKRWLTTLEKKTSILDEQKAEILFFFLLIPFTYNLASDGENWKIGEFNVANSIFPHWIKEPVYKVMPPFNSPHNRMARSFLNREDDLERVAIEQFPTREDGSEAEADDGLRSGANSSNAWEIGFARGEKSIIEDPIEDEEGPMWKDDVQIRNNSFFYFNWYENLLHNRHGEVFRVRPAPRSNQRPLFLNHWSIKSETVPLTRQQVDDLEEYKFDWLDVFMEEHLFPMWGTADMFAKDVKRFARERDVNYELSISYEAIRKEWRNSNHGWSMAFRFRDAKENHFNAEVAQFTEVLVYPTLALNERIPNWHFGDIPGLPTRLRDRWAQSISQVKRNAPPLSDTSMGYLHLENIFWPLEMIKRHRIFADDRYIDPFYQSDPEELIAEEFEPVVMVTNKGTDDLFGEKLEGEKGYDNHALRTASNEYINAIEKYQNWVSYEKVNKVELDETINRPYFGYRFFIRPTATHTEVINVNRYGLMRRKDANDLIRGLSWVRSQKRKSFFKKRNKAKVFNLDKYDAKFQKFYLSPHSNQKYRSPLWFPNMDEDTDLVAEAYIFTSGDTEKSDDDMEDEDDLEYDDEIEDEDTDEEEDDEDEDTEELNEDGTSDKPEEDVYQYEFQPGLPYTAVVDGKFDEPWYFLGINDMDVLAQADRKFNVNINNFARTFSTKWSNLFSKTGSTKLANEIETFKNSEYTGKQRWFTAHDYIPFLSNTNRKKERPYLEILKEDKKQPTLSEMRSTGFLYTKTPDTEEEITDDEDENEETEETEENQGKNSQDKPLIEKENVRHNARALKTAPLQSFYENNYGYGVFDKGLQENTPYIRNDIEVRAFKVDSLNALRQRKEARAHAEILNSDAEIIRDTLDDIDGSPMTDARIYEDDRIRFDLIDEYPIDYLLQVNIGPTLFGDIELMNGREEVSNFKKKSKFTLPKGNSDTSKKQTKEKLAAWKKIWEENYSTKYSTVSKSGENTLQNKFQLFGETPEIQNQYIDDIFDQFDYRAYSPKSSKILSSTYIDRNKNIDEKEEDEDNRFINDEMTEFHLYNKSSTNWEKLLIYDDQNNQEVGSKESEFTDEEKNIERQNKAYLTQQETERRIKNQIEKVEDIREPNIKHETPEVIKKYASTTMPEQSEDEKLEKVLYSRRLPKLLPSNLDEENFEEITQDENDDKELTFTPEVESLFTIDQEIDSFRNFALKNWQKRHPMNKPTVVGSPSPRSTFNAGRSFFQLRGPVWWFDHPSNKNRAEEPILNDKTYEMLFALYSELSQYNILLK